jgi:DNA recombination protein RmuC
MADVLLILLLLFACAIVALQVVTLRRRVQIDSDQLQPQFQSIERSFERTDRSVREEIAKNRQEASDAARQSRQESAESIKNFSESVVQTLDALKTGVETRLVSLQADNAKQLETMRATVDEKLQGTLERRLTESFAQVSQRLEAVFKGLGEMRELAVGVGDLKKILGNVKTRGIWGEVQLGAMLEEILMPDQFGVNVRTKDGRDCVEYAVKFAGRSDDGDGVLWLPIDSKFPLADYQRLVEAQERADPQAAEEAAAQLEMQVKKCAADICDKYVNPPKTCDFAILFLPTEGLFAEVMRKPSLAESVRLQYRVMIAGPTTLWAILTSLQVGFRTLAIQKRSSEVWNLLAAVKTEWSRYGEMLAKVQKKLEEAHNTIESAAQRNRAIGRQLREVQELPAEKADSLLALDSVPTDPES